MKINNTKIYEHDEELSDDTYKVKDFDRLLIDVLDFLFSSIYENGFFIIKFNSFDLSYIFF